MSKFSRQRTGGVLLRYFLQQNIRHSSRLVNIKKNSLQSSNLQKTISMEKNRTMSSNLQVAIQKIHHYPAFIANCQITDKNTMLEVKWSNNELNKYPLMFLRDNCMCSKCRDNHLKERIINHWRVNEVGIQCVGHQINDEEIILEWEDGHVSKFTESFLKDYKFADIEKDIKSYGSTTYQREFWDAETTSPSRFNYNDIMNDSKVLLNYIKASLKYGVSVICDMPKTPTEIFKFGERISYLKDTLYGPTFHVKTMNDPANVGYSPIPLYLHSDQPNYSYQPEVMLLNCIEQSKTSGESEIADAMKAAYMLKETNRNAYEILKEVNCRFDDIGKDTRGPFHVACDKPIIQEDNYGEIDVIRINDYRRGILVNSTAEKAHQWYKAYDELKEMIGQPENIMKYKLKEGEMLTFDNRRILHGRRGHENDPSSRWLVGAFIGMDEFVSKMRILEEEYSKED